MSQSRSVFEKINEEEMLKCQKVFDEFDSKNRGYIDFFDLRLALEKLNITFSHPYVFHKLVAE